MHCLSVVITVVCTTALALPAGAANRYHITLGVAGSLGIAGNQVVISKLRQHDVLWSVKEPDKPGLGQLIYTGAGESRQYLTANNNGEVFVTEKPTDHSYWGIETNLKMGKGVTWIGTSAVRPGPRRLTVDVEERLKDKDGKEIEASPVRLGPPPENGRFPKEDKRFGIMVIAP